MKKQYKKTSMLLVNVDYNALICTSIQLGGNGNGIHGEAAELRVRHSVWSEYEQH